MKEYKGESSVKYDLSWLDGIVAPTFVLDKLGKVIYWNQSCEKLTGVAGNEVINTNTPWKGFYQRERKCLANLVLDENWNEYKDLYEDIKIASSSIRGLKAENWCHTPTGEKYLVFEANAIFDKDGEMIGVIETVNESSDKKHLEYNLEKLYRAIDATPVAVYITDSDGVIEYVNQKYTEITGYLSGEVIGKKPSVLKSGDTPHEVYEELWKTVKSNHEWKGVLKNRRKDGSEYWSRNSIKPMTNHSGAVTHFVAIQEDMTQEKNLQDRLFYQANHDELTGLPNRRAFELELQRFVDFSSKTEEKHSLLFIDLDQFKVINDSCGHIAGDELLKTVARVISENLRKNDVLARLGGDEFLLLLHNCSLLNAQKVAQTLLAKVNNYKFRWDDSIYSLGMSIGIAEVSDSKADITDYLRRADSACNTAKDLGRNRVHLYQENDEELNTRSTQVQWVSKIQYALDNHQFHLFAQPIVSLMEPGKRHFELLIRLEDENKKFFPPGAFLPAAERFNLANQIDRWVVAEAFRLLNTYGQYITDDEFFSINLSGQSLSHSGFTDFVLHCMKENCVNGKQICFEITETAAITNLSSAHHFIEKLSKQNCRFALDDFGSGLSSFGYLKQLPVDYLKIDGMFVRDIETDAVDLAMVKAIHEIGKVMNIKTIAEFVENENIMEILKSIGVDYAQGYGIAKPTPLEELLDSEIQESMQKAG